MTAKVSIIIPCYNQAAFLRETLQSVLELAYSNWECIIVDDGSTDNSADVANDFCKNDSKYKYFFQTNMGLSAARNTGLEHATGKFIQFLDSDDLLEKNKIDFQIKFLNANPKTDIVYGPMIRFDSDTKEIIDKGEWMTKINGNGTDVLETIIKKNIMVISSPLIRKSVCDKIGDFNLKLKAVEDWEYWIRCAANNIRFSYYEGGTTLIRSHGKSMMKNSVLMIENQIIMRKSISKVITEKRINRLNHKMSLKLSGELGILLIKNKKFVKGYTHILKSGFKNFFIFIYHGLYWTKTTIISK